MRISRALLRDISKLIQRYSRYQQSCLSIEQYTTFGKNAKPVDSYRFGKHELPVRLAHIIREIDLLPKNLLRMPSVELVRSWYVQSFSELLEFEDDDGEEANRFTETLAHIKQRHNNVVETMAQGIMELRQKEGLSAFHPSIQYFLDRFYMNRIGIRILITQHLMLFGHEAARSSKSNFVGCFDPNCHVASIVEDAANNARFLCDQYYCSSPELVVSEHNAYESISHIKFAYLPAHLYHMLFELLKNAMRAVTENYSTSVDMPPIQVMITKGREDLTIKISDKGGGIPRSKIDEVFEYHYSTAPEPSTSGTVAPLYSPGLGSELGSSNSRVRIRGYATQRRRDKEPYQYWDYIAGYGYGLPLSRLYAKYFDGDLQLYSMEGYGTDAVIWLKALSTDASEVLPMYNRRTPKNYEEVRASANYASDWSSSRFYGRPGTHRFISTYNTRRTIGENCPRKKAL
ncbi:probable [pyruvate dehydrogenase (acetyl-transferring)] kinase, mitochondrial isoform X1 [Nematostella vectensis]|uniref:probable [pyruvate dehydrogenase (acetyl-transferring)] kinase, mitochondrial isoform X1 n=1 Tax=Nematostella vectensis TaxID=45351 RepID=UPI0013900207|nr:probable [pyruvate dehydrogenase (acetyl-transferring)] kinase, mitochondrial isoform X1 [Nematostella vectensis]